MQVLIGEERAGHVTVQRYINEMTPEGSIVNGIVADAEVLGDFIQKVWTKEGLTDRKIHLVINSSRFVGQTLEVPRMKTKETMQYVEREFRDIDRGGDHVYGFLSLGESEKGMRRIYAESVPVAYLQEMVQYFTAWGMSLLSVVSAESRLIQTIQESVGKHQQNFIVQRCGTNTLATVLFSEGRFITYNAIRCFHERESLGYARDMARQVSRIAQFMKANRMELEPENIFLAGYDEKLYGTYAEMLSEEGISVPLKLYEDEMLDDAPGAQHYLYALGAMYHVKSTQNAIVNMKKQLARKKGPMISRGVLAIALTAVVLVMLGLSVWGMRSAEEADGKRLAQTLAMHQSSAESGMLEADLENLRKVEELLEPWQDKRQETPLSQAMRVLRADAGSAVEVQWTRFDGAEGLLWVEAVTDRAESLHDWIGRIRNEKEFADVTYEGFVGGEQIHCEVAIMLKREEAEE